MPCEGDRHGTAMHVSGDLAANTGAAYRHPNAPQACDGSRPTSERGTGTPCIRIAIASRLTRVVPNDPQPARPIFLDLRRPDPMNE